VISKTLRNCPNCLATDTVRIILFGEPIGEPDPTRYVLGGCCISPTGEDPEMECTKCQWQGSKKDVRKATRLRRFVWTDEDAETLKIVHRAPKKDKK
jgi:hypothetical protein